jgi:hypothetical protein
MREGAAVFERLEEFAGRPAGVVAMALWGAAEAVALPVVPDVGLCLLGLAAPRQAVRLFAAVVAGAIAGTLVLASVAALAPAAVDGMLLTLPGIDRSIVSEARAHLERDGVLGFAQFGPGPPLKVYTSEWLALGGDFPGLVVGSILNRLTRVGSVVLVAAAAGLLLGSLMRRHAGVTLAAYATSWIVVYVALWT